MSISQALSLYASEHGPTTADPERIGYAVDALLPFWGKLMASTITGNTCRAYAKSRRTKPDANNRTRPISPSTIRRELGTLRAALEHCHREGYLTTVPGVALPDKPPGKERWLTRSEAARLLWAAWREEKARQHLPTFILLAIYSGHRSQAILSLQWLPNTTGGWVDLERGLIDFNPVGRTQTNKRRSVIPIPSPLLAHLRRVRDRTRRFVIESDGRPVGSVKRSFTTACRAAGITGVVRHTLRHTCCTWMMHRGDDIGRAAAWVGMSRETFEKIYAHHSPSYMADVKLAWERRDS